MNIKDPALHFQDLITNDVKSPKMKWLKSREDYEKKLTKWQKRLLHVQQVYFHQDRRVILVMEGWDASGKGGAIRRITERLDPRGYDVFPIGAPQGLDKSRHYLVRFQEKIPSAGKIAIFDRSWYGRVLVERVEGFASEQEWGRAYQEINDWEKMLTDDGYRIIKLFMHITPNEQLRRFKERLSNPLKQWKLTEEDLRNRDKWHDYEQAAADMFARTHADTAPWHVIAANKKWYARVAVIKTLTRALEQGVDLSLPKPDATLVKSAYEKLGID